MSDFDLSKLPALLARLDEAPRARSSSRMEPLRNDIIRAWNVERAEAAAAIRALMAANRRVGKGMIAAIDAVAAEREACAEVCRDLAVALRRGGKRRGRAEVSECVRELMAGAAEECEHEIRARGGK